MFKVIPALLLLATVANAQTGPSPEEIQVSIREFNQKLAAMSAAMKASLSQSPDNEQVKMFLGYFQLTDEEKKEYDEMWDYAKNLTPAEWYKLQYQTQTQGMSLAWLAINQTKEEEQKTQVMPLPEKTSEVFADESNNFVNTSEGAIYSKRLGSDREDRAPVIIGGGFPFNQTQFTSFNDSLAESQALELYDPICNGMSVLFDNLLNSGDSCRPYKAKGAAALLNDEATLAYAYSTLNNVLPYLPLSIDEKYKVLFRISRLALKGLSLTTQANALATLTDKKNIKDGQAILTGLSYGGLIAAKVGALYPGKYKAIALFSPGISNATHEGPLAPMSAAFEGTLAYRSAAKKIISAVANSPRYDAYLPTILEEHNEGFRNGLIKKMLGELDMNIADDMVRIKDRLYMISGGKDASIPVAGQMKAMSQYFKSNSTLGTYVLIPDGGHALWGNPAESQELAVLKVFEEIQLGDKGAFKPNHVYRWNKETESFEDLGIGAQGLARAQLGLEG